ncbi:BQ5605_C019g08881 [Microbotryum silenes-dioicae]|uniref:BQ5605_C019g08881 protein n=1 Tax=Microbotryum silenes-dioicae TaxID=796604 RepID=A0A2X0MQU9_9BASI|nr:BQ5605_C019g08881 [Microbotryum silenes-dioicae]
MNRQTASGTARLAAVTLLLTALLLAQCGPTLVNAIPTPAGEGQAVKVANVRPIDSTAVKFSAELPRQLPQCGSAWIKFGNSGNVRPLTLVLALQENLPIALVKANAKTTLDEVKMLGPVQVIDNIRSLDRIVHPFQPHRRRGDVVEVSPLRSIRADCVSVSELRRSLPLYKQFFAFFPNGTGYNMNLKRVIQTGSASCLTPKCKKGQYLSAASKVQA